MSLLEKPSSVDPGSVPLPRSLRSLIDKLETETPISPFQVRKRVLEAGIRKEDLQAWADLDHPATDSYGRQLVYRGKCFELMVMSWQPGDFSGIHDHGHTQWGAVQVFGPAEHAIFTLSDGRLSTADRSRLEEGEAVAVAHSLIHQMGNPEPDAPFLSLHVYGTEGPVENVTGSARLFDVENQRIQRVDGGVFFALPARQVTSEEAGPDADYPTLLRYRVEWYRRLRRMGRAGLSGAADQAREVRNRLFSKGQKPGLDDHLGRITDPEGRVTDSKGWGLLLQELKAAARVQAEEAPDDGQQDRFRRYASLYDSVIGQPALDAFMRSYWRFFVRYADLDLSRTSLLSLGCGTGLVEDFLVREMGLDEKKLLGIDISAGMVGVAGDRIPVRQGSLLDDDFGEEQWDIVYSGLNVFHYLPADRLEEAVGIAAGRVAPGGWFIGDFITPDHIRWYPNVLRSQDDRILSLRTPRLVESEGRTYQESEILNLDFTGEVLSLDYAGKHLRHLPSLYRIRALFERHFGGAVFLADAVTLAPVPDTAETCVSTRYLVMARK